MSATLTPTTNPARPQAMLSVMMLWTFERQGEIHPNCMPNIAHVFVPALIAELQKYDRDFNATQDTIRTERAFIDENGFLPIPSRMDANLVLVVGVRGNRKLEANKDAIETALSHMLSGVLHPRENIHVMLITE